MWPWRELVSVITNGNDEVNELFESKFNKKNTFSLLYDFLKSSKEYVYNTDIPHASCLKIQGKNPKQPKWPSWKVQL